MSLKNLMVQLDSGERTKLRLEIAVSIALKHQARLLGVFGQRAEAGVAGIVAAWPSEDYVAAANASKSQFEIATAGLANAEWRDIDCGNDTELLRHITDVGRYADLILLGQHDESVKAYVPAELPEEIVLNSGRPVLLIPYIGAFTASFERPLIAWNRSREAARAVNDAFPLIENCQEATVVSLDTQHDAAVVACDELARHLACHGIKSKTDILMVNDIGIMDMLLNRLTDRDADLLVMGAHGQIAFPFFSRGAGTKHILKHMTVPVLMSY